MKIRFITVLSTFLLHAALTGQTSWQWVNPLPQGNLLNGVTSVNQDTVFAVGDYGTIIKTTNGGTTWLVTPTAGGMTEVAAAGAAAMTAPSTSSARPGSST